MNNFLVNKNQGAGNVHAVLAVLALCFASACSPDSDKNDPLPAASESAPETAAAYSPAPATAPLESEASDCTRGEPEPILATGSEFKLSAGQGSETFAAPNGTEWRIRQFGCDHYAVEFTLTSQEKLAGPSDLPAWMAQQFKSLKVAESSQPMVTAISNGIEDATRSLGEATQLSEMETLTISIGESAGTKVVVLYDVAI